MLGRRGACFRSNGQIRIHRHYYQGSDKSLSEGDEVVNDSEAFGLPFHPCTSLSFLAMTLANHFNSRARNVKVYNVCCLSKSKRSILMRRKIVKCEYFSQLECEKPLVEWTR